MRKEMKRLTTAQFAKLHEVNKRTLHYYDQIGLFRPLTKAENGYRYYDIEYSNAIVHAFQKFRAPFSGKIVHIFPEQSAVI